MKRIMIFLCLTLFAATVTLAETGKGLNGKIWKGTYNLSSGDRGAIEINLRDGDAFFFSLGDEEKGYEYTGRVKKAVIDDNGLITISADILKEREKGIGPNTGIRFDGGRVVDLPFEVILEGVKIKGTSDNQEIVAGKMRFTGTSARVQWFLDKTGNFTISAKI